MELQPLEFLRSPQASNRKWSLAEARDYTRRLATRHYENFHVASVLLPRSLHQDFYTVYAFCRWADDLGDETGDPRESLRLLEWWRGELRAMYAGAPVSNPVFISLSETARRRGLPPEPFERLIDAFVQDQTVTRYRDWDEVLHYCERSANPVGRLVLMLCGYHDEERFRLSDATCTALQLANFWQDVAADMRKGRVYLPMHLFERHGYAEQDLLSLRFTPAFRSVMQEAVDYAQRLFEVGLPLAKMLDRRLAFDIDLFSRGGMKILDKIRSQSYNVLRARPAVSKTDRILLLLGSMVRIAFRRAA